TAPGLGAAALAPAQQRGAIPLAIHPAMTFSGTSLDLARLAESYCAVSAPTPVLPIAQALVVEMGAEPVVIDDTDRPEYADAISTASVFSRSIVEQTTRMLTEIGVENASAYLSGLLRSSVDEALRHAVPHQSELDAVAEEFRQRGER